MSHRLATAIFVVGSMLVAVAAYAADSSSNRSNPESYVKDSVITTKIKTQLAANHLGSLSHIKVDTDKNGGVWMTGTVNSKEEMNKAVAIARDTEGVKAVHSELTIQKDR